MLHFSHMDLVHEFSHLMFVPESQEAVCIIPAYVCLVAEATSLSNISILRDVFLWKH